MTIFQFACCAGLIALASESIGQATAPDSGTNAIEPEQHEQEIEQARAEMAEARIELAEAARRMARLQRDLAERRHELEDDQRLFEMEIPSARFEGLRALKARELVLKGMPPRLGILLGEPGSAEAATVVGLTPGSGAESAGIKQGDQLVSVNGQPAGDDPAASIRKIMSRIETGTMVPVEIRRGDEVRSFDVEASSVLRNVRLMFANRDRDEAEFDRDVVILRPDGTESTLPLPPRAPLSPRFSGLGHDSHLISNHAGLEPYFGTAEGVVVLRIDPKNDFALRDGDVVLRLDEETVNRPVDLGRLVLAREPGEQVVFEVMREGVLTQIPATIPDHPQSIHIHRSPMRLEFKTAPAPPDAPSPPQPL